MLNPDRPSTSKSSAPKPKKPTRSKGKNMNRVVEISKKQGPNRKSLEEDLEPEYTPVSIGKSFKTIMLEGVEGYVWRRVQLQVKMNMEFYECNECFKKKELCKGLELCIYNYLAKYTNCNVGSLVLHTDLHKVRGNPENPGGFPHICEVRTFN